MISGYVIDESTAEPIENVNVYISNTTFGSSTNKEGFYSIKSIPPNIHDLIVSVIGYKTVEQKIIIIKDSNIKQNFKLTPIIYEVSSIDISAPIPEQWLSDLEKFKIIFLGKTFRAKECVIENPEVLDFQSKSGTLSAIAQKPLTIKNKLLGYKIYCSSLNFEYTMNRNTWSWKITPHFEDLPSEDSIQIKKWDINRQVAYFGSMYHFLMSLKQNKLNQNGYYIYISDNSRITFSTERHSVFKVDYNSIIKPGYNNKFHKIKFNNFLLVKNHSIQDHITDFNDLQIEFGENYQNSWIKLKYGEMNIDEYGYPIEDKAFLVYGYWATLGIADLLPRYYKFNNDSNINDELEN
jgi:hypothetical protein